MKARHEFTSEEDYKDYLRAYFSGLALQGILSNRELQKAYYKDLPIDKQRFPNIDSLNCLAVHAFDEADQLLKQLENQNK